MNKTKSEEKKENKKRVLFPFFLVLTSIFFLYLAWRQSRWEQGPLRTPTDQVNFNLQKTLQRQELNQMRLQQDHFSQFKTRDPRPVQKKLEDESLSLEYDRTSENVAAALEGGASKKSLPSVDEVVQTQVFNEFILREQNEKTRREYARQFVENARRAGIEVKLTPDLRIRSIRRITSSVPRDSFESKTDSSAAQ
jgi:hypothetical protein